MAEPTETMSVEEKETGARRTIDAKDYDPEKHEQVESSTPSDLNSPETNAAVIEAPGSNAAKLVMGVATLPADLPPVEPVESEEKKPEEPTTQQRQPAPAGRSDKPAGV